MSEFEQDGGGGGPPTAAGASAPSPAVNNAVSAAASRVRAAPDGGAVRRGESDDMDDEIEDSGLSDQSPDSLANEAGRGDSNSSSTDSSSQQLDTSSSSTSPPVRRLPSVLRPPPANASSSEATAATGAAPQPVNASPSRNVLSSSSTSSEKAATLRQLYGDGNTPTGNNGGGAYASSSSSSPGNGASAVMNMCGSHVPQYYAHAASSSSVGSPSMARGYRHDRMLPSPTNGDSGNSAQLGGQSASVLSQSGRSALTTSSPREAMDVDGGTMMRGQKRRLGQYDPRFVSEHHMTSNSGSAAMNRQQEQQQQQQQQMANQYQYQQQLQQQQQLHHMEDDDDDDVGNSATIESAASRGSHGPRDALRYETWTSKQLRKKCSHLKLRGLKNVKKHVMVDALYRYYRNQRQKELIGGGSGMVSKATAASSNSNNAGNDAQSRLRGDMQSNMGGGYNGRSRYEHSGSSAPSSVAAYPSSNNAALHRNRANNANSSANSVSERTSNSHLNSSSSSSSNSLAATRGKQPSAMSSTKPTPQIVRHQRAHPMAYDNMDDMDLLDGNEERKQNQPRHHDMLDNEIHVASEDVIRLVDVVLSPVFVDRLAVELSRWQFWVDVRERYIVMLNNAATAGGASNYTSGVRSHHHLLAGGAGSHLVSSRNFKWSSMQLWEIWKELTFAYTKTCFEFTAAGMKSSDERDYINFCEGRPDVYYLHQRLHARPDLLHLIKSNEYIEEKVTSDASESIAAAQAAAVQDAYSSNSAVQLLGASLSTRGGHKRFKRIVPAPNQASVMGVGATATSAPVSTAVASGNAPTSNGSGANSGSQPLGNASARRVAASSLSARDFLVDSSEHSPSNGEGGSTENSETTGEDGSLGVKSSQNASCCRSTRSQFREVLAEQKYFGLLLQNFEAIFESLHNKKVLLAALRKDASAPDHMIADLHDDIHVLSALKKEFRNKLRDTLA